MLQRNNSGYDDMQPALPRGMDAGFCEEGVGGWGGGRDVCYFISVGSILIVVPKEHACNEDSQDPVAQPCSVL